MPLEIVSAVGSVKRGDMRVSDEVQDKKYIEVKVRVKDNVRIYATGDLSYRAKT